MKQYLSGHAATVNAAIRKAMASGQTVKAVTVGEREVIGVFYIQNKQGQTYAKWTRTDSTGRVWYDTNLMPVYSVWVEGN